MENCKKKDKANDYFCMMYELAKEYYENNDNLLVPVQYVTDDGKKLGRFIDNMRKAYSGTKGYSITIDQIRMLDKIGMVWKIKKTYNWEDMFSLAAEYYKENGNLIIPTSYETEDNIKLGRWIYNMRKYKKKYGLTNTQIEKLKKIGIN